MEKEKKAINILTVFYFFIFYKNCVKFFFFFKNDLLTIAVRTHVSMIIFF